MSYLNANTPDELRAAVSDGIDPLTSLQIEYDHAAAMDAKAFIGERGDHKWLHSVLEDEPFVFDAMRDATSGEGFDAEPDPGKAIVVLANGFDLARSGVRLWSYASDVEGSIISRDDHLPCHRCDLSRVVEGRMRTTDTIAGVFHIARGRYVVEFALCADCVRYFEAMADHVRIYNGDTYIQLF